MKRVGYLLHLLALTLLLVGALLTIWHAQRRDEDGGRTFCCRGHSEAMP